MLTPRPGAAFRAACQTSMLSSSSQALPFADPAVKRVTRDIRFSYAEAALFSFMVGVGETYLAAFLLAGGGGRIASGLIVALPLLVGAVGQIVLQKFVVRTTSQLWVTWCALAQALAFVPLSLMAWSGWAPISLVFLLVSLYWAAGMSAMPVWNFWIDGLVPSDRRPMFLAVRSRVSQISVLAGFLVGGFLLQCGKAVRAEMLGFAIVFALAATARFVSVYFLLEQSDSPDEGKPRYFYTFEEFRKRCRGSYLTTLFRFLLLMHGAVYLASPFFTPYMLQELRLSYASYVLLIAAAYVSKALICPTFGRLCARHGAKKVLIITACWIAPSSVVWLFSDNLAYLLVLQILGGIAWAGYELATILLIFEKVKLEERSTVLSYFNLLQSTMIATGSLAGAGALTGAQSLGLASYGSVFFMSSVARGCAILLFLRVGDVQWDFRRFRLRPIDLPSDKGSLSAPSHTLPSHQ